MTAKEKKLRDPAVRINQGPRCEPMIPIFIVRGLLFIVACVAFLIATGHLIGGLLRFSATEPHDFDGFSSAMIIGLLASIGSSLNWYFSNE